MSGQPHDALFKAVFLQAEHAAGLLATLVPAAFSERADWSTLSVLPGTYIDERLAERRSDLLFSVAMRGGRTTLIYVLLEHQSEPDRWMPLRLLGYLHRVWEAWLREHATARQLPAVLPVVVHHGQSGWTAAASLSELYDLDAETLELLAPHLPELRFLLDDLGAMPMELLEQRPMTDYGRLALLLLKRVRQSPDLVADLWRWMEMAARVLRRPAGREALALLLVYILTVLDTVPEGLPAALEEGLGSEGREAYMSAAQKLIDQGRTEGRKEGRTEGRKEGRLEGRAEGRAEMLLEQVAARFGAPPPAIAARVRAASVEELGRWAERILAATSVEDLFGA
jgi:predicted transposase YdaD